MLYELSSTVSSFSRVQSHIPFLFAIAILLNIPEAKASRNPHEMGLVHVSSTYREPGGRRVPVFGTGNLLAECENVKVEPWEYNMGGSFIDEKLANAWGFRPPSRTHQVYRVHETPRNCRFYVLSAAHLVGGRNVKLILPSGKEAVAKKSLIDPIADIAWYEIQDTGDDLISQVLAILSDVNLNDPMGTGEARTTPWFVSEMIVRTADRRVSTDYLPNVYIEGRKAHAFSRDDHPPLFMPVSQIQISAFVHHTKGMVAVPSWADEEPYAVDYSFLCEFTAKHSPLDNRLVVNATTVPSMSGAALFWPDRERSSMKLAGLNVQYDCAFKESYFASAKRIYEMFARLKNSTDGSHAKFLGEWKSKDGLLYIELEPGTYSRNVSRPPGRSGGGGGGGGSEGRKKSGQSRTGGGHRGDGGDGLIACRETKPGVRYKDQEVIAFDLGGGTPVFANLASLNYIQKRGFRPSQAQIIQPGDDLVPILARKFNKTGTEFEVFAEDAWMQLALEKGREKLEGRSKIEVGKLIQGSDTIYIRVQAMLIDENKFGPITVLSVILDRYGAVVAYYDYDSDKYLWLDGSPKFQPVTVIGPIKGELIAIDWTNFFFRNLEEAPFEQHSSEDPYSIPTAALWGRNFNWPKDTGARIRVRRGKQNCAQSVLYWTDEQRDTIVRRRLGERARHTTNRPETDNFGVGDREDR